jgi:predicted alpha/beta superfamily hydrolase
MNYIKMNYKYRFLLLARMLFYLRTDALMRVFSWKTITAKSAVLGEKRSILVKLPENYGKLPGQKYDVLYVLDGEWNAKLVADIQGYLEQMGNMPSTIIVGILNNDRDRDLTPTHVAAKATSGGAENFLAYIKNELLPYVNKTYAVSGKRILFGHSVGGLFAMYSLLNNPGLFDDLIISDPSFWWDGMHINQAAVGKLSSLNDIKINMYLAACGGPTYVSMGASGMKEILENNAPAGLNWKIQAYDGETHKTMPFKSIYDGLKFIYSDWSNKQ